MEEGAQQKQLGGAHSPGGTRRRARKSTAGVDYKALAGEETEASPRHANCHVARIVNDTFECHSHDGTIQSVADGSTLTSAALIDPDNPLSIHRPILITDSPESIGMKVPRGGRKEKGGSGSSQSSPARITIRDVGNAVGMSHPVIVMDVRTQEELDGWVMHDLVDYFEDEDRMFLAGQSSRADPASSPSRPPPRVLNQISLEFSHTPLRKQTRSPSFVRDVDWIDNLWPSDRKAAGDYPVVQYYCLTSTAGCYTDFHVDFGGTSVWYHVLSGRKVFLLAPPTPVNLNVYEQWLCMPDQASVFYPDLDGTHGVVKVTLHEDQTLLIPSGWIHAVYTPVDSIVVGGNFLHGQAISGQLDVHCVETRTRVQAKFRFPHFIRMMFYAGAGYLERMRAGDVCAEEVDGMGRLAKALRSWSVAPGGDADRAGSVAGTAAECARRVRCGSVGEMVDAIEREVERTRRDGIAPAPGYEPPQAQQSSKLKLSLKVGGTASPPRSSDGTSPRPKLKLKLGSLGAFEGAEAVASAAAFKPSTAKSKGSNEGAEDDDEFRITVASSARKKKTSLHSAIDPYRDETRDAGDDEWMPEGERRRKKKLEPVVGIMPMSIDPSPLGPSPLSPSRSPKSPKCPGGSMVAQQKGRPQNRPTVATKPKKVLTARERLKKKMKF